MAYHISIKELLPIVIATTIWGQDFVGKTILVRSDNVAAVAAINHQTSPVKEVAHLLRCLAFIMARFNIRLQATHIPGILNDIADALSRNNMSTFFSLVPQADKHPLIIPSSNDLSPRPTATGLDRATLDRAVEHYFSKGLAPATSQVYQAGIKRYVELCHHLSTPPTPASEELLCNL